jgi:hypothetical protein
MTVSERTMRPQYLVQYLTCMLLLVIVAYM